MVTESWSKTRLAGTVPHQMGQIRSGDTGTAIPSVQGNYGWERQVNHKEPTFPPPQHQPPSTNRSPPPTTPARHHRPSAATTASIHTQSASTCNTQSATAPTNTSCDAKSHALGVCHTHLAYTSSSHAYLLNPPAFLQSPATSRHLLCIRVFQFLDEVRV